MPMNVTTITYRTLQAHSSFAYETLHIESLDPFHNSRIHSCLHTYRIQAMYICSYAFYDKNNVILIM